MVHNTVKWIVILFAAKALEDPVQFYSERLFSSMKGAGTNDKMLIRIIVSRSEVGYNFLINHFNLDFLIWILHFLIWLSPLSPHRC